MRHYIDCFTKILDVVSLITQFVGGLVMYKNSPINRPTGITHGGNYNSEPFKKRNIRLGAGFLILTIGIFLSIISLLIKDFWLNN